MARPTRQGVDYFPLDIHLDDKFKFIQIKYGLEGFAVVIKLLQKIYSYGYWYQWGEDESLIFAHENSIDVDKLNLIIDETIKRGIFHEGIYENYQVLTSSGIQKRYKEIVKRRVNVEIVTEYLLIEDNLGVNANIMNTECIHDVDISTQSKVNRKESIVKEIIVEDSSIEKSATTDSDKELFIKIVQTFENNGFGTISDYVRSSLVDLVEVYTAEWVIDAMEESILNNVRNLKYTEAILRRWLAQGKNSNTKKVVNKKMPVKKTRFHMATQRSDNYTTDELNKVVDKKAEEQRAKLRERNKGKTLDNILGGL